MFWFYSYFVKEMILNDKEDELNAKLEDCQKLFEKNESERTLLMQKHDEECEKLMKKVCIYFSNQMEIFLEKKHIPNLFILLFRILWDYF
jgi:hypothetical protein